jgi:hypothetical protein
MLATSDSTVLGLMNSRSPIAWLGAEAKSLLSAAKGERLEVFYAVTLTYGLRRDEALGISWADVQFDSGLLHVRRQLRRKRLSPEEAQDDQFGSGQTTLSEPAEELGPEHFVFGVAHVKIGVARWPTRVTDHPPYLHHSTGLSRAAW